MKIHFVLVCEGPSDINLIPHLRSLLVNCGAEEATGVAPDYTRLPQQVSRDVESKVRAAVTLERNFDLLFIHRDSDSTNPEPRFDEIRMGVESLGYLNSWIGVVPVQETEAWLLLDESAIRRVSGRPNGRVPLDLPRPTTVERVAHPKRLLLKAILLASETTGRRRSKLKKKFSSIRSKLLQQLRPTQSLSQVPSWIRLRADTQQFIIGIMDPGG
jgi:hypothetical protein